MPILVPNKYSINDKKAITNTKTPVVLRTTFRSIDVDSSQTTANKPKPNNARHIDSFAFTAIEVKENVFRYSIERIHPINDVTLEVKNIILNSLVELLPIKPLWFNGAGLIVISRSIKVAAKTTYRKKINNKIIEIQIPKITIWSLYLSK